MTVPASQGTPKATPTVASGTQTLPAEIGWRGAAQGATKDAPTIRETPSQYCQPTAPPTSKTVSLGPVPLQSVGAESHEARRTKGPPRCFHWLCVPLVKDREATIS